MKFLLFLWLLGLLTPTAYAQPLASTVYPWRHAPVVKQAGYEERTLLQGSTQAMADLTIQAITIHPNYPPQPAQELDEEVIVVVKSGELSLSLGPKQKVLGAGSAVLIMPGDPFRLANKSDQPLTYYFIRYTSNEMPDLDLYRLMGQSFWIDYRQVPNTPNGQGGNRRLFDCASIMCRRVTMHMTMLNPGLPTQQPHTHPAAEIIIMVDNTAYVRVNGKLYSAEAGDVIFLESQAAHAIHNAASGSCTYVSLHLD